MFQCADLLTVVFVNDDENDDRRERNDEANISAAGATVALVVSLTSGCGSNADTSSKAGGEAAPITLRVGTDDGPGRPAADQISEFASQVKQLSDGAIIIEPVWQADGPQHRDWDQLVARMVVNGELDMGMIPARAWDTEGVTSLRSLNAPFLINSEEFMATVVSADIATEMLTGLDSIGITGLALVPESMRQVFSFGEPLLTPQQFRGSPSAPRGRTRPTHCSRPWVRQSMMYKGTNSPTA